MYSLVTSITILRTKSATATLQDLSSVPIRSLTSIYKKCILVLTHPDVNIKLRLDINDIQDMLLDYSVELTVADFLTTIGSTSLPTIVGDETFTINHVFASEVYNAGFKASLGGIADVDILLTKVDLDYTVAFDHLLATVNGLLHLTDHDSTSLKILGGGSSVKRYPAEDVSLLSFSSIGAVTQVPIVASQISAYITGSYANGIYVSLPDVDLSNKTLCMALAGIFHTPDSDLFTIVGTNLLYIDVSKIPFDKLYLATYDKLDWSSVYTAMGLPKEVLPACDINQFTKDSVIEAFFTLPNTFVIALDTDNLTVSRTPLEQTGLAGRHYSYQPVKYPVQFHNGLMPTYTLHEGKYGKYAVATKSTVNSTYLHLTRNIPEDDGFIDPNVYHKGNNPYAPLYVLDITSAKI